MPFDFTNPNSDPDQARQMAQMTHLRTQINLAAKAGNSKWYDGALKEFLKLKHAPTAIDPVSTYNLPPRPGKSQPTPKIRVHRPNGPPKLPSPNFQTELAQTKAQIVAASKRGANANYPIAAAQQQYDYGLKKLQMLYKQMHGPSVIDSIDYFKLPGRPDDQSGHFASNGSGETIQHENQRIKAEVNPGEDMRLFYGDNLLPGIGPNMSFGRPGHLGPIQDPVRQWIRKNISATGLNSAAFEAKAADLRRNHKTDREILDYLQKKENFHELSLQSQASGGVWNFVPGVRALAGIAGFVDGADQGMQAYDQKVTKGYSQLGAIGSLGLDMAQNAFEPITSLQANLQDSKLSRLGKLSAIANAAMTGFGLYYGARGVGKSVNTVLKRDPNFGVSPVGQVMNSMFGGEQLRTNRSKSNALTKSTKIGPLEKTRITNGGKTESQTQSNIDFPNISLDKYRKLGPDKNILSWKDIEQARDPKTGKIFATQLHADRQGSHPYVTEYGRELPQTGGFENNLTSLNYGKSGYPTSSSRIANKIIRGMDGKEALGLWHLAAPETVLTSREGVRNYFHELYDMRDYGGVPESDLLKRMQSLFGDRRLIYNGVSIHPEEVHSLDLLSVLLENNFKNGNIFKDRVTKHSLTKSLGLYDGNKVAEKMNSLSYKGLPSGSVVAGSTLEPRVASASQLRIPEPLSYSKIIPGTALGKFPDPQFLNKIFEPDSAPWLRERSMNFDNFMNMTTDQQVNILNSFRSLDNEKLRAQFKKAHELGFRTPRPSDYNAHVRLNPKLREMSEEAIAHALGSIRWHL